MRSRLLVRYALLIVTALLVTFAQEKPGTWKPRQGIRSTGRHEFAGSGPDQHRRPLVADVNRPGMEQDYGTVNQSQDEDQPGHCSSCAWSLNLPVLDRKRVGLGPR